MSARCCFVFPSPAKTVSSVERLHLLITHLVSQECFNSDVAHECFRCCSRMCREISMLLTNVPRIAFVLLLNCWSDEAFARQIVFLRLQGFLKILESYSSEARNLCINDIFIISYSFASNYTPFTLYHTVGQEIFVPKDIFIKSYSIYMESYSEARYLSIKDIFNISYSFTSNHT